MIIGDDGMKEDMHEDKDLRENAGEEDAGEEDAAGENRQAEDAADEMKLAAEDEVPVEEAEEAGPGTAETGSGGEPETAEPAYDDEEAADADTVVQKTEKAAPEKVRAAVTEVDDEKKGKMRWYVLHTYSGREAKVRDTIERLIKASDFTDKFSKVLVATEEVAEMKKGKKTVSKRKLFPSYILIEMEMSNETWSLIENVPGVTHFVGGGKKPFPIPKRDVDRILGRMEKKEGIIPEVPFTLGEHVRVADGPFADFTGVVDEINPERGKLKVLVSIFGRETPVELDFLQIKTI